MKALTGLDSLFLHLETPETPMHVASLHLFDLPEATEATSTPTSSGRSRGACIWCRCSTAGCADAAAVANPVWVEDDAVDLDYHVRRVALARPGTQAQLEACAGAHPRDADGPRPPAVGSARHRRPGDRPGRPSTSRFITRCSTAPAGMALAGAGAVRRRAPSAAPVRAASRAARAPGLGRRSRAPRSGTTSPNTRARCGSCPISCGCWRAVFGPGAAAQGRRARSRAFGPQTPLNVSITGERRFAALSIPLDDAEARARAHDAKLNDVVLALCSGALRRYLSRHGGIPTEPLIAGDADLAARGRATPSTRRRPRMTLVNLATDIADPRAAAARDSRCGGCHQGAGAAREGRHSDRLPFDRRAVAAGRPGGAVRAIEGRRRDAADHQRGDLERRRDRPRRSMRPARGCAPTGRCRSSSTGWGSTSRW